MISAVTYVMVPKFLLEQRINLLNTAKDFRLVCVSGLAGLWDGSASSRDSNSGMEIFSDVSGVPAAVASTCLILR